MRKTITFLFLTLFIFGNRPGERIIDGIRILTTKEELVDPKHTIVLVVDMQNAWISSEGMTRRKDRNAEPDPKQHAIVPSYQDQVKNTQN